MGLADQHRPNRKEIVIVLYSVLKVNWCHFGLKGLSKKGRN